jgi:hypothetical protein
MDPMFAAALLLAHQSDWLSMVLVCIPLGAFVAILGLANHRADRDGLVDMTPPPRKTGDGVGPV